MSGTTYTTGEAAKAAGISRQRLQQWIARGLKAPEPQIVNGRAVRLWTAPDIARLRQVRKSNLGKVGRPRKRK